MLITFSVFLVNFWSIICQFLSNVWQFYPQFFYEMFCQFNYLLNYCWKSIVKSIIFSIIAWCGLVEPGFESSLNPSLDSKGEGLSRVWTQAYNWPIRGSVSDPCPCLDTPLSGQWRMIKGCLFITRNIYLFWVKSMDNFTLFLSKVFYWDFPLFLGQLFVIFCNVFVIFGRLAQKLPIFYCQTLFIFV